MKLAGRLGNQWKPFAIEFLNFKRYEVDNFESDGTNNQDRAFKMLTAWKCRENFPTVSHLICLLNDAYIDRAAWAFLDHKNSDFNGFNIKVIIADVLDVQKEANKDLDKLFEELFKAEIKKRFKFLNIVNSMESKILKIASGCIDFRLQALSYSALLNFSLQFEKGGPEGIKQLPPLHQKLQDAIMEVLSSNKIMTPKLSFTNYFEGGSYRGALEFFSGGFAIDDMLPILKKRRQFQNLDYLCLDMKTAPQTTLSDLKREFVKQRHKELQKLKTKLFKGKTLSQRDYKLICELFHNIPNIPEEGHGQESRKDEVEKLADVAINMCKASEQATFEYAEFRANEKGAKSGNLAVAIDAVSQHRKLRTTAGSRFESDVMN
ncbi:hypothetical protein scyTo_0016510, partial [Scyliorhinus torazame]|nr:hypothetical protein [Scyliorhinus torazame]